MSSSYDGSSEFPLSRPDDAGEWQNLKSPAFSGDFYREADTVTRGVTLGSSADVVPGPNPYKDFAGLDGDYYREPDDLCKGLSLGGSFPLQPTFDDKLFSGSTE